MKIAITITRKYIPGSSRTLANKCKMDFKMIDELDQLLDRDPICFDPHLVHRFEIHNRIVRFMSRTGRGMCCVIMQLINKFEDFLSILKFTARDLIVFGSCIVSARSAQKLGVKRNISSLLEMINLFRESEIIDI
jgi:hypothetical protein